MSQPIPYVRDMRVHYGAAETLSPLVRRVLARNPSMFTYHGTGTYIVGRGRVAVIDPGPDQPEHIEALMRALAGESVSHILVTHTHCDHSPAAQALKRLTGAPTHGFGPHGTRRAGPPVEEGADYDFTPERELADGAAITGAGWRLRALHTPGHTSNHLCFALEEEGALFTGDHVMGWSTSVISPPDGDMRAYLDSLNKLLGREDAVYYPTHGPPIGEPQAFVRALIAHRHEREAAIVSCVERGLERVGDMVEAIYTDVPLHLHGAAARSVLAHLVHLVETGRLDCEGELEAEGRYRPRQAGRQ